MFVIFDEDDGAVGYADTKEEADAAAEFLGDGCYAAQIHKVQGLYTYYQASQYAGEDQVCVRSYRTIFHREPGRVEYPRVTHGFGRTEEEARGHLCS